MANLPEEFTNVRYLSKSEVSREMKIGTIDTIWANILNYRAQFTINLDLFNIERYCYKFVQTPVITNKVAALERKMTKANVKLDKLENFDDVKIKVKTNQYATCLLEIAKKYNVKMSDSLIENIIKGDVSALNPSELVINNYFNCLKYIEQYSCNPLNKETLLNFTKNLSGNDNKETIYRSNDLDNGDILLVNRSYNGAPANRIENMMDMLFEFSENERFPVFVRAITAFYYISYIKPFTTHSEEIAVLFLKYILAHNDFEVLSSIVNFEFLIGEPTIEIANAIKEVEKTNDLTYLVWTTVENIQDKIENIIDEVTLFNAQSLKKDFYHEEEPKKEKKQEVMENQVQITHNINYEVNVALPTFSKGIDENQVDFVAERLVELNPRMKKTEALFYAGHCAVGNFYTIQQFKTLHNCAYETARTSMDNLVALGYYSKEMVKNKYVYTPIPRK